MKMIPAIEIFRSNKRLVNFCSFVFLLLSLMPKAQAGELCDAIFEQIAASGSVQRFLNCPPEGCEPLLHKAIGANDWEAVDLLLKWGADPDAVGSGQKSARQLADETGQGGRLHDLHSKHVSDGGISLASVRQGLKLIGLSEADAEEIINKAPNEWPRYRAIDGRSKLIDRALDRGQAELIQFLAESKGLKLGVEPDTRRQSNADEHVSEFNLNMWTLALSSDDSGHFFNFLRKQRFPVLPTYSSSSPLSLFVQSEWRYIPWLNKYSTEARPLNEEAFKYFLDEGVDPIQDGVLMTGLLNDPVTNQSIWKILKEHQYPAKLKEANQASLAFARYFDIRSASEETRNTARSHLHDLGVELMADLPEGQVNGLFVANSYEMARHLVEVENVDPRQAGNPGGFYELPPVYGRITPRRYRFLELKQNGYYYLALDLSKVQEHQFQAIVEKLETQRLSEIQAEVDELTTDLPEGSTIGTVDHKTAILSEFRLVDYLMHEAGQPRPFTLGESKLDGGDVLQ